MGKDDESAAAAAAAALRIEGGNENGDPHCCCRRSTLRWVVTLVLSLQLLVFLLVSLPLRGHHGHQLVLSIQAPIMFMFRLHRSAAMIKSYSAELESNLSSHIHAPNLRVSLYSVKQIPGLDVAEVRFQLLPERTNSSYDVKNLRGNLVKLFLQEKNLSLAPTTFGEVTDFQINKLQGGVTIVPERSQKFLSRRSALFNFTLNNGTISSVSLNFQDFKRELSFGLCLRPHEVLVTRLTNLNGSTVEAPVIVQSNVFRAPGRHLHPARLKQLARHVSRHRKNLGLNLTMFGRVGDVNLAPVLEHLVPHQFLLGPAPAPAPVSGNQFGQAHSVYLSPAPASSTSSIQTGFADAPGIEDVAPLQQQQQHQQQQRGFGGAAPIAAAPGGDPGSGSGSRTGLGRRRMWVVVVLGLVASVLM